MERDCTTAATTEQDRPPSRAFVSRNVVTVPHSPGVITNTAQVAAPTPDLKPDNNKTLTVASVSQIRRLYLPLTLLNSGGIAEPLRAYTGE